MKTFVILPTDERFLNLTSEQREYLWQHFLIDNPEIERKMANRFTDEEFDKEWDALVEGAEEAVQDEKETSGPSAGEVDFEDIEAIYKDFISNDDDFPDYKEILEMKGIVLDDEVENSNKEEVPSEEVSDWEEI